ncbi:MAG: uroporphyrinogen decarboxylase family protein, partial [Pseudomonadota bacterium]
MTKLFLQAINGQKTDKVPFWYMRQAGRYLPEYRELRKEAGSFLDLCYNPDFAVEVTLQPIRRFDMDAAILFSDILVIPHALGQKLDFITGKGPQLDPIRTQAELTKIDYNPELFDQALSPVYE